MERTMIKACLCSLLFAPLLAHADISLYGRAHASLDYFGSEDRAQDINYSVNNRQSRIGVKGNEELGGGLEAVFRLEWDVDLDDGTDNLATRTQYVGISGSSGTLVAGSLDTPYKTSTQKLDVFLDTAFDYSQLVGGPAGLDERYGNTISYVSPNFSGFSFALSGVAAEDGNDAFASHSAAMTYQQGAVYIALAGESVKDAQDGARLGLGLDLPAIQLGAIYEDGHDQDEVRHNAWLVNGAVRFGDRDNLIWEYGERDWHEEDIQSIWAVGLAHHFSKGTSAYVAYGFNSMYRIPNTVSPIRNKSPRDIDTDGVSIGLVTNF